MRNSAPNQVTASGTSIIKCLRVPIPHVTEHQDSVEPQWDWAGLTQGRGPWPVPETIRLLVTNPPQLLSTVCSPKCGRIKNIGGQGRNLFRALMPLCPSSPSWIPCSETYLVSRAFKLFTQTRTNRLLWSIPILTSCHLMRG